MSSEHRNRPARATAPSVRPSIGCCATAWRRSPASPAARSRCGAHWCATPPGRVTRRRRDGLLTDRLRGRPRRPRHPRRGRGDGRRRAHPGVPARALRAPASRSSRPTSSCWRGTARSCSRRPSATACSCGSRPRSALRSRSCKVLRESMIANDVSAVLGHRQRHDELHPHRHGRRPGLRRRRWPARRSSATPRPTPPRTSTAPTRPPRSRSWPRSPSTRACTIEDVPFEGIERWRRSTPPSRTSSATASS